MKNLKSILIVLIAAAPLVLSFTDEKESNGVRYLPSNPQRVGDPQKGYEYLTTGDFLKSGLPYKTFLAVNGKDKANLLKREGKNAVLGHGYNLVEKDGIEMVIPTCLQCHAQEFEGQLVLGMGNTSLDFSGTKSVDVKTRIKLLKAMAPKQYAVAEPFLVAFAASYPYLETEVRGVNTADRLAAVLAAHRDPQTLKWSDSTLLPIPDEVTPTDVPAWWLLKKKNAMFYTGFGRGDFSKFLMLSNLLTVADTAEAREVSTHFTDVLAYIHSLEPPAYPKEINKKLAKKGRRVFNDHCSGCHGTYGNKDTYPNKLIPAHIIKTDSALCKSIVEKQYFLDWFNNGWFVEGDNPAQLVAYNGYIAPPLDGVWATAPYMHNGSVPTIVGMLNSKERPTYWTRNFKKPEYNYDDLGWVYQTSDKPEKKKYYNTTLSGYGNHGHYFGDKLSDEERTQVIEYLKTL